MNRFLQFVWFLGYHVIWSFGIGFSFFLLLGLAADFRSIDKTHDESRTRGIKTVEAQDFQLFFEKTENGVIKHGFVSDYFIDCTTGAIRFSIRDFQFNYSYFTERALKVYQPRDACRAGGFEPEF